MNDKMKISIVAIILIAISFYSGMKFDQSQSASVRNAFIQRGAGARGDFAGAQGSMRGNGGFISGEVLSIDATSITIKLKDGGSKIIFVSNSTSILKSDAGTLADISIGKQVTITGSANPDGSVTAQSIQFRQPTSQPAQ